MDPNLSFNGVKRITVKIATGTITSRSPLLTVNTNHKSEINITKDTIIPKLPAKPLQEPSDAAYHAH
jgi:hypothetical protein